MPGRKIRLTPIAHTGGQVWNCCIRGGDERFKGGLMNVTSIAFEV